MKKNKPKIHTNTVNKTSAFLQTTGGKNEPEIVMNITIRNSERNKTTHKSKKMSNTDPTEKTGDELRWS
jgi:hypothetical protein